jgi:hypothetical protein
MYAPTQCAMPLRSVLGGANSSMAAWGSTPPAILMRIASSTACAISRDSSLAPRALVSRRGRMVRPKSMHQPSRGEAQRVDRELEIELDLEARVLLAS